MILNEQEKIASYNFPRLFNNAVKSSTLSSLAFTETSLGFSLDEQHSSIKITPVGANATLNSAFHICEYPSIARSRAKALSSSAVILFETFTIYRQKCFLKSFFLAQNFVRNYTDGLFF